MPDATLLYQGFKMKKKKKKKEAAGSDEDGSKAKRCCFRFFGSLYYQGATFSLFAREVQVQGKAAPLPLPLPVADLAGLPQQYWYRAPVEKSLAFWLRHLI